MAKTFFVTGIIIKRRNYREAARWVTLFTRERGKIEVLAKGVSKVTSKRGGQLELFNLVRLQVVHGKRYNIAAEVELITSFPKFRQDLKKVGLVYELCEIVDLLTPEEQPHPEVFKIMTEFIKTISDERSNLSPKAIGGILIDLGFWDGRHYAEKMREPLFLRGFIENIVEKRLRSPDIL